MIKNYNIFIGLKQFNETKSPEVLQNYVSIIKKDLNLLDNVFDKKYVFNDDRLPITIKLHITKLNKDNNEYNGTVNAYEILKEGFDFVKINIEINDLAVNLDKVCSTIYHELSHVYELYKIKKLFNEDLFNVKSWDKMINLIEFNKSTIECIELFNYFKDLVRFSFKHEMRAITQELYYLLKTYAEKGYSREDLYKIYKKQSIYNNLRSLMAFNSELFISDFKNIVKKGSIKLLMMTNGFNYFMGYPQVLYIHDLEKYYKKWNIYFNKTVVKYYDKITKIIDSLVKEYNLNEDYIMECPRTLIKYPDLTKKEDDVFTLEFTNLHYNDDISDDIMKQKINEFLNSLGLKR